MKGWDGTLKPGWRRVSRDGRVVLRESVGTASLASPQGPKQREHRGHTPLLSTLLLAAPWPVPGRRRDRGRVCRVNSRRAVRGDQEPRPQAPPRAAGFTKEVELEAAWHRLSPYAILPSGRSNCIWFLSGCVGLFPSPRPPPLATTSSGPHFS